MSKELEERIAHLERALDDMSDVVAGQAKQIAVLERRAQMLMERAAAEEAAGQDAVPNQRPPHW